jgi:hypothetical protein
MLETNRNGQGYGLDALLMESFREEGELRNKCVQHLGGFHPEMALFRNLGVNRRDSLCGLLHVRLRVIP